METTRFPIDTDQPKLDIELPVGVHVLKLTVFDDAGMASRVDTVVIRVKAEAKPDVVTIVPASGTVGATLRAVIYGKNLDLVESVAAYLDSEQDERIQITIRPSGSPDPHQLPISMRIMAHAQPGLRTIEVVSPTGVATVDFTVLPETRPEPKNVVPASGQLGNSRCYDVTVTGENLKRAQEVVFLLRGRPDNQLRATIKHAAAEEIALAVSISANAELGGRQVQVTAASGTGVSPTDVRFTVVPGPLQVAIILFGLAAIVAHALLRLPPQLYLPVGLLYLVLIAAMYLPLPGLSSARPWLRWLLIVFAMANVLGWIIQAAQPQEIRFGAPLIEFVLAALVFVESQRPQCKDGAQSEE